MNPYKLSVKCSFQFDLFSSLFKNMNSLQIAIAKYKIGFVHKAGTNICDNKITVALLFFIV